MAPARPARTYSAPLYSIGDDWPQDQNFGVLVNNKLYYPGDSFTPCPEPHAVLAAPCAGPWLRFADAVNFIKQDSAERVFLTHNNILNQNGHDLNDRMFSGAIEEYGKKFLPLQPGESIEV